MTSVTLKLVGAATVGAFDYQALGADAEAVRSAAQTIRAAICNQLSSVIQCGRALTQAKALLKHGAFGAWLDAEFNMSIRTAETYMLAAETYGAKCETVSYLPLRTLYQLQAPSAPTEIREQVIAAAEAGAPIPVAKINDLLAEAKYARQLVEEAAKKSPEQRKRLAAQKARRAEEHAKWHAEQAARQLKTDEATEAAYQWLVAALGDRLSEFQSLVWEADGHALVTRFRMRLPLGAQPGGAS